MSNVTLNMSATRTTFQQWVSERHFGTAFENRGQSVSPGSPVTEVISQLPISILRFPGGTQTESYFNPGDPENSRPRNIFDGQTAQFEPISRFISYVTDNGIKPAFVIPTFRYFEKDQASNGHISAQAREEIFGFVSDVLTGRYGEVNVAAFEIGNEWFNARYLYNATSNPTGWTAAEFGRLQGKIVETVQAAIDAAKPRVEPDIWVQTSQHGSVDLDRSGVRDNVEFLAGLSPSARASIDGVVDHFYQPTRALTPLEGMTEGWVASNRIARMEQDGWTVSGPNALDIVTTEWNVRATRNGNLSGNDANITGLERMPLTLAMFADMIAAGVDVALAFTAQALGPDPAGPLSRKGETTLTPKGMLFDMMGRALPETRLVDPNRDGKLTLNDYVVTSNTGQNVAVTFTFVGPEKTIFYFASGVSEVLNFSADGFRSFMTEYYRADIKLLTAVEGGNPLLANVDARVIPLSLSDIDGRIMGDGRFEFSLPALSVLQIGFYKVERPGETPPPLIILNQNHTGTEASEAISMGLGDDTVRGLNGNDTISGGAGDDRLFGGPGHDLLFGEDGADNLLGGRDSDTIYGGASADSLSGEDGNDWLYGGEGADYVSGGRGSDQLFGEEGNDLLEGGDFADELWGGDGSDSLFGDAGEDKLYGGMGNDTLTGGEGADQLWGGLGRDQLFGEAGDDDLRGDEDCDTLNGGDGNDILLGGSGNDRLLGELGNDLIYGGAGNDMIWGGWDQDRLFGDTGNDSLWGGGNKDILEGGDGNDWLFGGSDTDTLIGGSGADRLHGDGGHDTLIGGLGADVFVFDSAAKGAFDVIRDFRPGEDLLEFHELSGLASLTFRDIVVNRVRFAEISGEGYIVRLEGVQVAQLDPSGFLFL